jgi:DNA-binding LacI/PurR family transcriptional regulator
MPLSTIGMDIDVMCKAAWNLMSKKLKNEYYTSEKEILVDGKFILRESISKKHP